MTGVDRRSHRVAIAAFDGVQSLDLTGPAEVFAAASALLETQGEATTHPAYEVTVVGLTGREISTESGVTLLAESIDELLATVERIDTLVVPGGFAVFRHADDPDVVASLDRLVTRAARLVTVCTGAHLAAATGALDGRTVTTHWARAGRVACDRPDVTVDADPIFVHSPAIDVGDLDVWSSAGVTAGIDLTLAIVEHDHSTDLAQEIARWLVVYLRRPGGQSQFATPTWVREAETPPVLEAQRAVVADPGADHRVAVLARTVAMSARHFVRRFTAEVGLSPAKFVAGVRTDAARHDLERTTDTVAAIAERCGFGTAETMRRTFHRQLGVSPEAYRARFARPPAHSSPIAGPAGRERAS